MEEEPKNNRKIILHLCAKLGSDSKPYAERPNEYDVRIIGEDIGVENYNPPPNVYGIIANPPCTMFSIARTTAKTPRDLREGMRLVKECLRIIWECQYRIETIKINQSANAPLKFWALENPASGMLEWFLGKPVFTYQPYEFGDNCSKKTALWGRFNMPIKPLLYNPIPPKRRKGGEPWGKSDDRSTTSPFFAKVFYEANP